MARIGRIKFDEEKCKGCGLCVNACPKKILTLQKKLNLKGYNPAGIVDEEACISCAICATMCPDCVITIDKE